MSQPQANAFIEKLFSDDAFVEESVRKVGGLTNDKDKSNENFIRMGRATGYDFTEEELGKALSDLFKGKAFAGFRKLLHVGRLMTKVNKRLQKEAKN